MIKHTSESMMNWSFVTLWEATDKEIKDGIVPTEAVGRVRSVSYAMIDLQDGETFPKEIRHLKYLESFSVQSNANRQIRTISLGEEICELEYLKDLTIFSFGINGTTFIGFKRHFKTVRQMALRILLNWVRNWRIWIWQVIISSRCL